MSKNTLYNLIKLKKEYLNKIINLAERTHSSGTHYFYFELAPKHLSVVGPYKLTSHHLSVYEKATGTLDSLSQYHYTAYFHDSYGKDYRLHIYFDEHDNSLAKPFLAEMQANNEFQTLSCLEFEEAFKTLAYFSSQVLVKNLRTEQAQVASQLKFKCETLEKEAETLSINWFYNRDKYTNKIRDLINKIDEMLEYTPATRDILAKKSFLNSLESAIESTVIEETFKPKKTKKILETPKNFTEKSSKSKLTNYKDYKPALKDLSPILKVLELKFQEIATPDLIKQLSTLESLYVELKEIELQLSCKLLTADLQNINNLRNLKIKIESKAKQNLQMLLIMEKFEETQPFKIFYHLLSPEILGPTALVVKKTDLFNFLLNNQIINIYYKNFTVHNVFYSSMIDYCFKATTNNSSMYQWLNILVQKGASLLDLDSSTNLPYAAILLLDSKHPFSDVLKQNAEATLNNPLFFKQLNNLLRFLFNQDDFKVDSKIILQLIDSNEERIKTIELSDSLSIFVLKKANDLEEQLKITVGEQLYNQIFNDPEIMALRKRLTDKANWVISKVNFKERLMFNHLVKDNLDDIKKSCTTLTEKDIPSFNELKKSSLMMQLNRIRVLDLYMESREIKQLIQSHPHSKNGSKLIRKLKTRYDQISTELFFLQHDIDINNIVILPKIDEVVEFDKHLSKEHSSSINDLDEEILFALENTPDFFTFLTECEDKEAAEKKIKQNNKLVKANDQLATAALTCSTVKTLFSDSTNQNPKSEPSDLLQGCNF
ncbi:MAG: hypothetical protein H0U70_02980 [Tatlockia sp.]|nr:hypothetical protein [Tatlockia sp.]